MQNHSKRIVSFCLALTMLFSVFCFNSVSAMAGEALTANGGLETLYAEWADSNAKGARVEYKKSSASSYSQADNELIRQYGSTARVDIVGLSEGSYDIKVTTSKGSTLTKENINVKRYDRSGYAHFNYTEGIGGYNDDGTKKDNAIVIYVTEENKNTVTVPGFEDCGKGIGWILNNNRTGMSKITAKNSLIIRIIGKVTNPEGTTAYNSTENGGTKGDNGHMARIRGGKNITIEGIGYDALVYDWGFHFIAADDGSGDGIGFEVRNITFDDYPEDAVGMEGVQVGSTVTAPVRRCWVHNNSFLSGYCASPAESDKGEGDGSCDFKRGEYFTLSYNYFEDCHKTNLVGASDSNYQYNLTFHHNWWKNCASRGPLLRQANIHIYNNYYDGNTSKTIDTRANSYAFVEANYLEGCKNPITTTSGSAVKAYNNIFKSCLATNAGTIVSDRTAKVSNNCKYSDFDTNSGTFYYDSANKVSKVEHLTNAATAKSECIAYSGVMKKTPVEPGDTSIIINKPSKGVALPLSLNFTSGEVGEKMSKAGIKEFSPNTPVEMENVIFNMGKKYSNTSTSAGVLKEQGITFKVDQEVVITLDGGSSKGYYPVVVNSDGEAIIEESGSATVKAGIYTVESSNVEKEAQINSLSIQPVGAVVTTTEGLTTTTEKAIETTTSDKTTETTTKKNDTTTEKPTETTTKDEEELDGVVAMGSYSLNSSTVSATKCTYKNISFDVRSVDSTAVKLRLDNSIRFKVDRNCKLTMVVSSKGIIIIDENGNQTEKSKGTITVELKEGSYTITGANSKSNTGISSMKFEENGSSSDATTEKQTEATTNKADSTTTEKATESTTNKADSTTTEKATESTTNKVDRTTTEKQTESTTEDKEEHYDYVDMKVYSLTKDALGLTSLEDSFESLSFDIRGISNEGVKIRKGDTIRFETDRACYMTVTFADNNITLTDDKGNSQTLKLEEGNEIKVKLEIGSYTISGAKSSKNSIVSKLAFAQAEDSKPTEPTTEASTEATTDSEKTTEATTENTTDNSSSDIIYGDLNGDKKVDNADVKLLMSYVLNMEADKKITKIADVDGDNKITATDVVYILNKIKDSSYKLPVSRK